MVVRKRLDGLAHAIVGVEGPISGLPKAFGDSPSPAKQIDGRELANRLVVAGRSGLCPGKDELQLRSSGFHSTLFTGRVAPVPSSWFPADWCLVDCAESIRPCFTIRPLP